MHSLYFRVLNNQCLQEFPIFSNTYLIVRTFSLTLGQLITNARTTRILDGRNSQKLLHQTWANLLTHLISHNLTQSL